MPLMFDPPPWRATLLPLVIWLAGCSAQPPRLPPAVQPAVPPLPAVARQPKPPPVCSPTCSEGLRIELQSWPIWQTEPAQPARPAKRPTTA